MFGKKDAPEIIEDPSPVATLFSTFYDVVPPTTLLFALPSLLLPTYLPMYVSEFFGTLLMILLTFSPGTWFFSSADATALACVAHGVGVVLSDYYNGGQQVNPAVSYSLFLLGKQSYAEFYVRVAGQMMGGLVAFPLFRYLGGFLDLGGFGGPTETAGASVDSMAAAEFMGMFILCIGIYLLNFGPKYNYWVKQSLTAVLIRALIVAFPSTGPALNPMLATTYAYYATDSTYPSSSDHYLIYWAASFVGAVAAALVYAFASSKVTFLGKRLKEDPDDERWARKRRESIKKTA